VIRLALHAPAGPRGGPRTYGVALARALARSGAVDLVVLTDRPEAFGDLPTVKLTGPRPWSDHVQVARILRRLAPHLYHNTKNALPWRLPCPGVVTMHDLAYHHFPETFGPLSRLYLRAVHRHAARRADRVIAVSHHAKEDLVATLGLPPGRIDVIYHGVAEEFHRHARPLAHRAEPPYVLSVGTIQARKNLDVLVRAVALLRQRLGRHVPLRIAGRRGWKTRAFDEAARQVQVDLLEVVPDDALPALYGDAAVFVQPSSYEGFGLTAAEAMASGAPVVAAAGGSLPEVVGDAGLFVPPRDPEALAHAIGRVLDDPRLEAQMRLRGRARAREFTWERSAQGHIETYRAVLDARGGAR